MNELNIGLSITFNFILVLSAIIGLFYMKRQTRVAEKELNIKIVEVNELAHRIEKESKERENLTALHLEEVTERQKSVLKIWEYMNNMFSNHSVLNTFYNTDSLNDVLDISFVCIYLAALIHDSYFFLYQDKNLEFNDSIVKKGIINVLEFLGNYQEKVHLDISSSYELYNVKQNFENKKTNYDFGKMSVSEIDKILKTICKEFSDEIDKVATNFNLEIEKVGPQYKKSKEDLIEMIKQIIKKAELEIDSNEEK
jgi:hypothetical protein